MAHIVVITNYICFSIAIVCLLSCTVIEGRRVAVQKLENNGTIKTIESEDGDVIDCVHIHKQPTYGHPLVKSIQLKPSSYPNGTKPSSSQRELVQLWHKNGKCPEGTIPIRRTPKRDFRRAFPSSASITKSNPSIPQVSDLKHEYATAYAINNDKFYGGHASINVWNPKPEMNEFSLSQIWLVSDTQQGLNTIEAGWTVFPQIYGDSQTRFFVYWTRDEYRNTGCYDLRCQGFMQTNKDFALGFAINPVSTYNGDPFEMTITIFKDTKSGNWWLQAQGITIGYWPGSLFTGFAEGASKLEFGGEIINRRSQGRHTTTQMGSGHFPSEGYKKSSYFRDIKFVDNTNTLRIPQVAKYVVTNPLCYDIQMEDASGSNLGINFYYGGLGYSANCP